MNAGADVMEADAEVVDEPATVSRALALAPRRDMVAGLIRPVAPPAEILAAQEETRTLIETALKEGRDYGNIPGTDKKKRNLLKAGAERVCAAFAVVPQYTILEREIDHDRPNRFVKRTKVWRNQAHGDREFTWAEEVGNSEGLYRYVVRCQLVHRESGVVIGEGVGSCSTMESKYIDRPRDLENTVLKMAKKRGYVDSTLTTFGLSDQFTQDMEDVPREATDTAKPDAPKVDFLDTRAPGKDNKGQNGKQKTWRQVVADNPSFVVWALDKMERLSTEEKLALRDALTPPPAPEPTPAQLALELTEALENARVLGFLTDEQDARCGVALDSMDEGDLRRTLDWLKTRAEAQRLQPSRQPVGVGSSSDLYYQ